MHLPLIEHSLEIAGSYIRWGSMNFDAFFSGFVCVGLEEFGREARDWVVGLWWIIEVRFRIEGGRSRMGGVLVDRFNSDRRDRFATCLAAGGVVEVGFDDEQKRRWGLVKEFSGGVWDRVVVSLGGILIRDRDNWRCRCLVEVLRGGGTQRWSVGWKCRFPVNDCGVRQS